MNLWIDFLKLTGGFCFVYFVFIMIYVGPRPSFHYVWLAAGTFLRGCAWLIEHRIWILIPVLIRFALIILIFVGLLLLVAMEIRIFSAMWVTPREPVKYLIILGACVRGTRVTRSLSYRLKKAAAYADKHPQCLLIVSGGQGPGEDITEAQAMSIYLQKLGIPRERILLEDQSVNTRENLIFSREIILAHEENMRLAERFGELERDMVYTTSTVTSVEEEDLSVAICSNNFHMCRAMSLASAIGKWKINGLAAMTDPFMWLSFTLREGIALFKEMLFGYIPWKQ